MDINQFYKDLEVVSKDFKEQVSLFKDNVIKVKKSEALGSLDDYIQQLDDLIEYSDSVYIYHMEKIFDVGFDHDKDYISEVFNFLIESIKRLKAQNEFFERVRERGDISEQCVKLINLLKEIFKVYGKRSTKRKTKEKQTIRY